VLKKLDIIDYGGYGYGFHVWREPIVDKGRKLERYIGRYLRHPVISHRRIIAYDGTTVAFIHKNPDGKKVSKKKIDDFISSLIQHIPPKQFKMVRHYGMYSRKKRNFIASG
jgi:hypothetical protein